MAVRLHKGPRVKRIMIAPEWFHEEVAYGQKILGLEDWEITVEVVPKYKDEGYANIHDGHLTAVITFRQDVLPGEARFNVFHELGHLMFRSWDLADQKIIDDMVPSALTKQVNDVLSKGEEESVERFAHAIVRLTPDRREPDGNTA